MSDFKFEDSAGARERSRKLKGKYDTLLRTSTDDDHKHYFRITTHPEGFNNGYPYYFSALSQLRLVPGTHSEVKRPESKQQVVDFVSDEIAMLAEARRRAFARETRLRRLQTTLQKIWQSLFFNIIIMLLIVSNFVFTVRGMENKNPERDAFYEKVDLLYTVIFALGTPLPLARQNHLLSISPFNFRIPSVYTAPTQTKAARGFFSFKK